MKIAVLLLPAILFAAGCSPECAVAGKPKAKLVLAERDRESVCAIAIKPNPAPSVRYAAEEFRDHVKKLTGVELPVEEVAIGKGKGKTSVSIELLDDAALGDEGFEITSTQNALSIRGGKRGVIYGVYEVLEQYGGVMWLADDFTHLKELQTFAVPVGVSDRQIPAFASRRIDTFDRQKHREFNPRLRTNEFAYDKKYGGSAHAFDQVLGKCHTFQLLVPVEKYYDSHPEYFSLVKGKRLRHHTQLCLTNPDVFRIVLSNVLHRIELNKSSSSIAQRMVRNYGVSADDWNNYCECENCAAIDAREESHSGCVIWFVNKIAEAVEKKHPDVMIETLAYMYSRKPPKYLKPRDNVMICLCTIECDFSKPMTENRHDENTDFRKNVLKWRDISKHLYLWDYAANWRATPVPYPNIKAYAENIKFYHEMGIRYLFEHGISTPAATLKDLKGWLGAKLMWNPYQPAKPLIRRFCEGYYGKGAPFVLEFIRLMGEQPIDEIKTPITYAVTVEKMPFSKDFYIKGLELWESAEAAVNDEPEAIKRNVRWGRFGLEYALAAIYAQAGEWRAIILSEKLVSRLDRAEFGKMRESARYCQRMLDSDPSAMVSSRLNDFRLKGYLKALADSEFPESRRSKVLIQDWAVNFNDFPKSKTIFRIKEKDAVDRHAIQVKNEKRERSLSCSLKPLLALDKGKKYRLRARIKVNPPRNSPRQDIVLSVDLFDRTAKKVQFSFNLGAKEATGKYEWYDLGEWTDEGNDCILYVHPRGSAFTFDCFEVSIVK